LDFWATWCKPCVYMMSRLQVLYDAYAKKGLMVMGVSIDDGKDRVKNI
ncbi:MAG TPA: AhpC/TSA family protein, partial [Candidatus Latescibacteria bacterium]|nr:AhpC/TSA family protein [Candidatus Latescibacterota bacterium]